MEPRIIVGVSGASGTILAYKTIIALAERGFAIDLVISSSALYTAKVEMGDQFATARRFVEQLPVEVQLHGINDVGSGIASGSYPAQAMVITPCSMATIAAVAHGLGDNCLRRAADVTLKERRPLIIVPRETPLSAIHLENMLALTKVGATIVPPVPAWYTHPTSLSDVEDFIVGKTLDALKIAHDIYPRWKSPNALQENHAYNRLN
ncbi:MAG: UbiX family flavin prenyltransferase [Chlamydiales bacterium]